MSGPVFTSYGFSQPLITNTQPIISQRDPTLTDRGLLGQLWVNESNNSAYVATGLNFVPPTNRIETTWTPIGIGTGDVTSFTTNAGNVNPIAGVVDIVGGLNINTAGAGNVLTVNLDNTVSISGSFTAGTTLGNINADHGNITLRDTDILGLEGVIEFGGNRFIHNRGTENTFIGLDSGNLATSGTGRNVGVGALSLNSVTTGTGLIGIGYNTLFTADTAINTIALGNNAAASLTDGQSNVIIGTNAAIDANCSDSVIIGHVALNSYTSTGPNVAIGRGCLFDLIDGINNLVISCVPIVGGINYDGNQSNNVLIQNEGDIADNNVIRIGTQGNGGGQQDTCYIAGIVGNSVSNTELVTIDNTSGQLGTTAIEDFATSFIADSGTATPALNAITIAGGTNVTTSASGSTVTINASIPTSLAWSTVSGATNMAVNNGYIVNGGSELQFTLPVSAALGDVIEIVVLDTAVDGWRINQNASQYIIANGDGYTGGPIITTVGVGGSVATGTATDFKNVRLLCVIADTAFVISDVTNGNITFT